MYLFWNAVFSPIISPLKPLSKLYKPCDYKRKFTVWHFWKEKGSQRISPFAIEAKERFDPLFPCIFTPLQHCRVEESPLKLSKKLAKPCDYKRRFTVCHFWKEKGNGTKMCPAHTGQLLASHAGVFRGARFRPSPQTPTQPRIIFLSNCFVRVVSDQSTVLK